MGPQGTWPQGMWPYCSRTLLKIRAEGGGVPEQDTGEVRAVLPGSLARNICGQGPDAHKPPRLGDEGGHPMSPSQI